MKLNQEITPGQQRITAYDTTQVSVDGTPHALPLALDAQQILADWRPARADSLAAADIAALLALRPGVVLIGTGSRQRLIHPAILRPLIDAGIGYEVMDLGAACRTFNLLVAEGRAVAVALLGDPAQ